MEDSHAMVLDLNKEDKSAADKIAFFGVYDGHGGEKVAIFTGDKMHDIIKGTDAFEKKDYSQSLKDGFLATDVAILADPVLKKDPSGCAATSAIITPEKIVCGNAGDSRTIMSVKGQAKALSYDHKPTNEGEKTRICAAGGFVDMGRVNGNLALSRSIGDFEFKDSPELPPEEQVVTAFPEIVEHTITSEDEFVILACDGIWDCLTSQQAIDFVRRGVQQGETLVQICESMIDVCLAPTSGGSGIGCDNMSILIVALLQGRTLEEWYEFVKSQISDSTKFPTPDELSESMYDVDIKSKFDKFGRKPEMDFDSGVDNEDAPNSRRLPISISDLVASGSFQSRDGVVYLDNSGASILAQLGVTQAFAGEDQEEDEEEDAMDTEEDHESKIELIEEKK